MHGAMANSVRVKQVASEASRASSVSGCSGHNFFFPDVYLPDQLTRVPDT